jgi:hypothetical protein
MEVSDVRRRLRTAIDEARRSAGARRQRKDEAVRAWERALETVITPAFHQLASALTAEGYRFKTVTPGTTVRLVPERGGEQFVEIALDTDGDEPLVMIRSAHGRGRRMIARERALASGTAIDALTDAGIASAVIDELAPFLAR